MKLDVLKKELEKITGQQWAMGPTKNSTDENIYNKELRVLISVFKEGGVPVVSFYEQDQKISYAPLVIDKITKITRERDYIEFYVDYLPTWSWAASVKFF